MFGSKHLSVILGTQNWLESFGVLLGVGLSMHIRNQLAQGLLQRSQYGRIWQNAVVVIILWLSSLHDNFWLSLSLLLVLWSFFDSPYPIIIILLYNSFHWQLSTCWHGPGLGQASLAALRNSAWRRVRHSNTIRHHITVYLKMEYTPKTMATSISSIGECDGKSANSMQSMYNVIRSSGHPKAGGFPHFLQRSNDTKGLSKPLGTPAPPWSCTKNSSDLQDLSGRKDQRMSTTTRRILTSL